MSRNIRNLAVVGLLIILLVAGCGPSQQVVVPTGLAVEVGIKVSRYDSAWADFPESEFTQAFVYELGADFYDLSDSTWWERLQGVLIAGHQSDWKYDPVKVVPSVEWLKENVGRGAHNPFYTVEFFLPTEGVLQMAATREDYKEDYDWNAKNKKILPDPMHIVLEGKDYYSSMNIFEIPVHEGSYKEELSHVQKTKDGMLLFKYKDGDYALINIPPEFMSLSPDDLDRPWTTTVQTPFLKAR